MLFEWSAMDRPHKVWSKDFFSTVIVMAFLVSVIMFFIEGILPVMVVWAIVFMLWSTNRVQPQKTDYSLTNWGLRMKEGVFRYEEMRLFWLEDRWGSRVLRVFVNRLPWQLVIVVDKDDEDEIKRLMVKNVPYEVPVPSAMDKVVKWLGEKMPLE